MVGVAAILLTAGAMIGLAHGLAVPAVAAEVVRLVGACAAQIPAAWVLSAVVVFLFGWRPRWVVAGWGVLLACILLAEFGKLWQLPDWLLNLSPFAHSPSLPGGSWAAGGLALLVLVVAARRRRPARWRPRSVCLTPDLREALASPSTRGCGAPGLGRYGQCGRQVAMAGCGRVASARCSWEGNGDGGRRFEGGNPSVPAKAPQPETRHHCRIDGCCTGSWNCSVAMCVGRRPECTEVNQALWRST
jgi:hypothetical protein